MFAPRCCAVALCRGVLQLLLLMSRSLHALGDAVLRLPAESCTGSAQRGAGGEI
jgi:hypothetical protein